MNYYTSKIAKQSNEKTECRDTEKGSVQQNAVDNAEKNRKPYWNIEERMEEKKNAKRLEKKGKEKKRRKRNY